MAQVLMETTARALACAQSGTCPRGKRSLGFKLATIICEPWRRKCDLFATIYQEPVPLGVGQFRMLKAEDFVPRVLKPIVFRVEHDSWYFVKTTSELNMWAGMCSSVLYSLNLNMGQAWHAFTRTNAPLSCIASRGIPLLFEIATALRDTVQTDKRIKGVWKLQELTKHFHFCCSRMLPLYVTCWDTRIASSAVQEV